MKPFYLYLLVAVLALGACSNGAVKIPVVGNLDSLTVANDTFMQKGFEQSYEYAQEIVANQNLVYDVRAYGGSASLGEFAIMRRSIGNHTDTLVKGKRQGKIATVLYADLDKNNLMELYIITQSADTKKKGGVLGFEINQDATKAVILESNQTNLQDQKMYFGKDTFYLQGNFLIRQYPLIDTAQGKEAQGYTKIYYKKAGLKIQLEKMESVL